MCSVDDVIYTFTEDTILYKVVMKHPDIHYVNSYVSLYFPSFRVNARKGTEVLDTTGRIFNYVPDKISISPLDSTIGMLCYMSICDAETEALPKTDDKIIIKIKCKKGTRYYKGNNGWSDFYGVEVLEVVS